jgi:hypothetical protein
MSLGYPKLMVIQRTGLREIRSVHLQCVTEMHLTCSIPMKDMHNLRLCLEC